MTVSGSLRQAGLALGLIVVAAAVAALVLTSVGGGPGPSTGEGPSVTAGTAPSSATGTPAAGSPGAGSPGAGSPGPSELLPNMRSVRATAFSVERVAGGDRRLRFQASLANLGPGPLLLRPRPPGSGRCPAGRQPAVQVLHRDAGSDGEYRPGRDRPGRVRFAGCMLVHPGHDHWHYEAMASYALRDPRSGVVVSSRPKVSFCLRDNRRVQGVRTRVPKEHFGECSRTTRQGISPGWVDVYTADLPGQSLALPDDEGRRVLCLDLAADPRDLIRETDEDDNGTSVGVVVEGTGVQRWPQADCRVTDHPSVAAPSPPATSRASSSRPGSRSGSTRSPERT